jgi:hypothetical protein
VLCSRHLPTGRLPRLQTGLSLNERERHVTSMHGRADSSVVTVQTADPFSAVALPSFPKYYRVQPRSEITSVRSRSQPLAIS